MSFERLITCSCGHAIDDHEGGGCRHIKRGERFVPCQCRLGRTEALDLIVEAEREAIHARWRTFDESA